VALVVTLHLSLSLIFKKASAFAPNKIIYEKGAIVGQKFEKGMCCTVYEMQ